MASDLEKTSQCWSEHTARFSGRNAGVFWWEAGPELHRQINRRVSGSCETDWVAYTLERYFEGKLPLARILSLGCGDGQLERRLAKDNVFLFCEAYDLAKGSVEEARRLALLDGYQNINYQVADINTINLPAGVYDSVWIHSAMHHFKALEHIFQQIHQSLKPGGLLILNEYIGPNRFQFPERQKEIANLCLNLLPVRYRCIMPEQLALETANSPFGKGARWFLSRALDKIRDGDLSGAIRRRLQSWQGKANHQSAVKTAIAFPSLRDVIASDPSEAVRSGEILEVLEQFFEINEKKDWGGNILQFLLAGIAGCFSAEDPQSQALLKMLANIEDTLLQCGELQSDFAWIAARPRL